MTKSDTGTAHALPMEIKDFVDKQQYRQIVETMLDYAKSKGAHQAEVGAGLSTGLDVTVRLNEVETLEFNRDKSVGITVYFDNKKGSASTTDLSNDSLHATVDAAINLAKFAESDPCAGLADSSQLARQIEDLDLYHPWDISVEKAIELAKITESTALNYDDRVVNSEGASVSTTQGYTIYANSHGFFGDYPASRHSLSCQIIAKQDDKMERDYDYSLARIPVNLDSPEKVGELAAKKVVSRLNPQKLSTDTMPVIFKSEVASGIIGHFLAAISGGRLFRKTSFLQDSLNQQVFPKFIEMYERPHLKSGLGSAPFDGDGVRTTDKHFVLDGVVSSYILSVYSAKKLGMTTTGNSGGVHNLYMKTGDDNLQGLLAKMGKGLLVTELMGQGVNLVSGDYSRGASGYLVENGEIKYPVSEITIASNLKDMFKNIVAISNDIDHRKNILTGSMLVSDMMVAGS